MKLPGVFECQNDSLWLAERNISSNVGIFTCNNDFSQPECGKMLFLFLSQRTQKDKMIEHRDDHVDFLNFWVVTNHQTSDQGAAGRVKMFPGKLKYGHGLLL